MGTLLKQQVLVPRNPQAATRQQRIPCAEVSLRASEMTQASLQSHEQRTRWGSPFSRMCLWCNMAAPNFQTLRARPPFDICTFLTLCPPLQGLEATESGASAYPSPVETPRSQTIRVLNAGDETTASDAVMEKTGEMPGGKPRGLVAPLSGMEARAKERADRRAELKARYAAEQAAAEEAAKLVAEAETKRAAGEKEAQKAAAAARRQAATKAAEARMMVVRLAEQQVGLSPL